MQNSNKYDYIASTNITGFGNIMYTGFAAS